MMTHANRAGLAATVTRKVLLQALLACLCLAVVAVPRGARAEPLPQQETTPDDIPGEIAVDFKDDLSVSELGDIAKRTGLNFEPTIWSAVTEVYRAAVPVGQEAQWVRRLQADPRVEVAEPVARVHASWTPNDPMLAQQWHLERVAASRAWSYATGRGVVVAVVDTGVACEDRDPFSRGTDLQQTWCLQGYNVLNKSSHANDDHGHGTHVAGTIAQSTNNSLGAAGLAFHARLLPVKVLDSRGSGTTVGVADGVRWAAEAGAQVINLSLGSRRASRILLKAIQFARSQGVVVVAAAGNNGTSVEYPAAFDGVIAVSATDPSDKLASFSSRGKAVDIAAPGVQVLQQTICNGGRGKCERFPELSGTSMASPHVAGAAALLMSMGVTNADKVEQILLQSARLPKDQPHGGPLYGAGIVDAGEAVASTFARQAAWRLGLVLALTLWVFRRVRRRQGVARPWRLGFVLAALAFGPGLGLVVPWVASRVSLPLDLLSRPVPEWDLIVGVSVHRWLPLANFGVPLVLSAIGFGIKRARPLIAGCAIGTAAYLASLPILGISASTLQGQLLLSVFAIINVLVCVWLAALNLDERERA